MYTRAHTLHIRSGVLNETVSSFISAHGSSALFSSLVHNVAHSNAADFDSVPAGQGLSIFNVRGREGEMRAKR